MHHTKNLEANFYYTSGLVEISKLPLQREISFHLYRVCKQEVQKLRANYHITGYLNQFICHQAGLFQAGQSEMFFISETGEGAQAQGVLETKLGFDQFISVEQSLKMEYVYIFESTGSSDRCGKTEPCQPISKLQLTWSGKIN